ncbi:MAG TPA: hypothetical protein VFE16_12755 [Candidatus Cybelea sp.]|nr:hypothetical protein [Candidatus Cybelea sp.]
MRSEAKQIKKLLYVADWYTKHVYVYDYASGKLEGQLKDFTAPSGFCVDSAGDIWITDLDRDEVIEYAHGGTTPLKTLPTKGGADGCSVAPNGNLAVSNLTTTSGGGTIAVFKRATGHPLIYSSSTCSQPSPPGYDSKGNLYLTTWFSAMNYVCELPAHGTSLRTVKITGSYGTFTSTSVMWDGEHLALTALGRTEQVIMNRVTESRSGDLTVVGQTTLTDPCASRGPEVLEPFIVGKKNTPDNNVEGTSVVGGVASCYNRVDTWHYPAGGEPARTIPKAPKWPYSQGVSISD